MSSYKKVKLQKNITKKCQVTNKYMSSYKKSYKKIQKKNTIKTLKKGD